MPMLTLLPPGEASSFTVNVAVPQFSVVTRPEVGVTVIPAARLDGHCVSTLVENGLTGRANPFSWIDDASSTQSPPRPVMLVEANTRAFARLAIRLISTCPFPNGSATLQP